MKENIDSLTKTKSYDSEFKFKVILDILSREEKSIEEICKKHNVAQAVAYRWKKTFLLNGHTVFSQKQEPKKMFPVEKIQRKIIQTFKKKIKILFH